MFGKSRSTKVEKDPAIVMPKHDWNSNILSATLIYSNKKSGLTFTHYTCSIQCECSRALISSDYILRLIDSAFDTTKL
jgi:hypothetical protein